MARRIPVGADQSLLLYRAALGLYECQSLRQKYAARLQQVKLLICDLGTKLNIVDVEGLLERGCLELRPEDNEIFILDAPEGSAK